MQLSSKTKQKLKIKITGSEHTYQLEEGSEAALAAAYYSTAILGLQLPLPAWFQSPARRRTRWEVDPLQKQVQSEKEQAAGGLCRAVIR